MKANEAPYFAFPLSALSFCADRRERIEHIISWACIQRGFALFDKPEIAQSPNWAEATKQTRTAFEKQAPPAYLSEVPRDFKRANVQHYGAVLGASVLNVKIGSVVESLKHYEALEKFQRAYEAKHGTDVSVRLLTSWVFETRDAKGMNYREFALLCAIYSTIGAHERPVRITRDMLIARALGYKSPRIQTIELATRTDGDVPLTYKQINYALNRLEERGFFARARPNKRQTFYSNKMDRATLEKFLLERERGNKFHADRKAMDAALMAKIKHRKALGELL